MEVPETAASVRPAGSLRVRFEKPDPRRERIVAELESNGRLPVTFYVPDFEPWELEQAEFARLRVVGFCGDALKTWAERLGLPPGVRVMDKREMGRKDIARTYAWNEFVISERLREILIAEDLSGWLVEPIQHHAPQRDHFPPLYQLFAVSELLPLAPETELELRKYEDPARTGVVQYNFDYSDLYGTTALFERGPLSYRRQDLAQVADINRTREVFLEVTVAHPYFILSQRARQAFLRHRVRGDVEWEPVVILG